MNTRATSGAMEVTEIANILHRFNGCRPLSYQKIAILRTRAVRRLLLLLLFGFTRFCMKILRYKQTHLITRNHRHITELLMPFFVFICFANYFTTLKCNFVSLGGSLFWSILLNYGFIRSGLL